jgi:hypothetical protein
MFEQINEPIEVLCAYVKGKALPLFFRWNNKRFKIDKVNLVHSVRRGRDKMYFYSVSNQENYYKLCFDTEKNNWSLSESYAD